METWSIDEANFFNNIGKEKNKVHYEQMGPRHPFWEHMLYETEDLLKKAGRVYDQATVEAIAMDEESWFALSKEAGANMEEKAMQRRMGMLSEALGNMRKDAESQRRIDDMFGEGTRVNG